MLPFLLFSSLKLAITFHLNDSFSKLVTFIPINSLMKIETFANHEYLCSNRTFLLAQEYFLN